MLVNWAESFCGNLGNYYLSIAGEKSMLCCPVSDFDFLGSYPVGGKKGVFTTPVYKGLGPQTSTKKLAHVGFLLGHLLSQNHVPKVSDLGPTTLIQETQTTNTREVN